MSSIVIGLKVIGSRFVVKEEINDKMFCNNPDEQGDRMIDIHSKLIVTFLNSIMIGLHVMSSRFTFKEKISDKMVVTG